VARVYFTWDAGIFAHRLRGIYTYEKRSSCGPVCYTTSIGYADYSNR